MAKRIIGQVFAERSVPTNTGPFFAIHPVTFSGSPAEGAPLTLTPDTSVTLYVYVVGGRVPVAGDNLICHGLKSYRGGGYPDLSLKPQFIWIAEPLVQNGGGILIAGCACTSIPGTLTMTSSAPTSNNGIFQNATLVYQATPPAYTGIPIGSSGYLSTASYTDQFGDTFRYYFYCQRNQFFLTRVYEHSIFGSPYEDSVRYTWTLGYGNTCAPFWLSNGRVYAGGDASCVVTISA